MQCCVQLHPCCCVLYPFRALADFNKSCKPPLRDGCTSPSLPGSLDSAIASEGMIANDVPTLLARYPSIRRVCFSSGASTAQLVSARACACIDLDDLQNLKTIVSPQTCFLYAPNSSLVGSLSCAPLTPPPPPPHHHHHARGRAAAARRIGHTYGWSHISYVLK
jgi:hypothetical protein